MDTYAIIGGGPLQRFERRLHVAQQNAHDLSRRLLGVVSLAYLPILGLGLVHRVGLGAWPMVMRDIAPHARALVVLPLLLIAETAIDERAFGAGRYLLRSGLVPSSRLESLRAIIARTARLRDSALVELALLALTAVSILAFPATTRDIAFDDRWCLQPTAFVSRFLFFRLMWRWGAWGLYLRQLVRIPLVYRVSHPDRVGGLSALAGPSVAFGFVIMALSASVAAEWGDQLRVDHIAPSTHAGSVAAFAIVAFVVACGPLVVFTLPLRRLRWRGVQTLGAFAQRYSAAFERRWLSASGEEALGASDIQSLNDLGGVFERVEQLRLVVAPRGLLWTLLASIALPLLPLVVAEVGATELLRRFAKALL